jgi:holo-[acyl-carrier protein] synthase
MQRLTTSVGIDLEDISRFRYSRKNRSFLAHIFTQHEISYYKSKGKNPQSLAGMFAAKEAVVKALSQLEGDRYSVSDFAIDHDKEGAPFVRESERRTESRLPKGIAISLSITHTRTLALAVAIAQKK